jgi:hypothetical protein
VLGAAFLAAAGLFVPPGGGADRHQCDGWPEPFGCDRAGRQQCQRELRHQFSEQHYAEQRREQHAQSLQHDEQRDRKRQRLHARR